MWDGKRDSRGVLIQDWVLEVPYTREQMVEKYGEWVGLPKPHVWGEGVDTEIKTTNHDKQCVVYLFQVQMKRYVRLRLAVSPMIVHDKDVVENYMRELVTRAKGWRVVSDG